MSSSSGGGGGGTQVENGGGRHPIEDDSGLESLNGSASEEEELAQRIVAQVEFYFSDENILRDSFLLKHVRRNREGYVSLKLMASFRKVKSLTKSWEAVRDALRGSTRLEVNPEGTKVRRRDPLPPHDETGPSRSVVAFGLPWERPSVEAVAELFARCGPISLIRLLRPGAGAAPPDVKRFLQRHPEVSAPGAAVVEFERHEGALAAIDQGKRGTLGCTVASLQVLSQTEGGRNEAVSVPPVPRRRFSVSASLVEQGSPSPTSKGILEPPLPSCCAQRRRVAGVLRQPRGPDGTRGFHATHA